jgi:hypothetical protein
VLADHHERHALSRLRVARQQAEADEHPGQRIPRHQHQREGESHLAQAAMGPEPDGGTEQRRRQQASRGQGHVAQVEPVEAPDVAEALGEAPGPR